VLMSLSSRDSAMTRAGSQARVDRPVSQPAAGARLSGGCGLAGSVQMVTGSCLQVVRKAALNEAASVIRKLIGSE